jgi:Tol biopolymer transport system component/DNA-binding winged helix-turn-helix (wHTH) protein
VKAEGNGGSAPGEPFRIGEYLVRPALNRIIAPDRTIQLEPKIMEVLVCLAEARGDVVPKQVLIDRVWAGVFVTDDVLVRAIAELRRAFRDEAGRPTVIETIRKRGYRLLATVTPMDGNHDDTPIPTPRSAVEAAARRSPSVTVFALLAASALVIVVATLLRASRHSPSSASTGQPRFLPLTTSPGNEVDPALSPDGVHLAYASDGPAGGNTDVFVKDLRDGSVRRLTTSPLVERAPAWSPDGRQLVFVRLDDQACEIDLLDVTGGSARRLRACGNADSFRMAWSPDGASLALSSRDSARREPAHIDVISIDGGSSRRVTNPPAGTQGDEDPAFSPDGRSIAFVRRLSGSVADLYLAATQGGAERRLTVDNADLEGVAWGRRGDALYFSSSRAGSYSLWRIGSDGGVPQLVVGGGSKMKHPAAAAAGTLVAYENWRYEMDVWQMPLDGDAAGSPLAASSDEWSDEPAWSPDGSRVAFVSTRSGADEIWIANHDGSEARQMTRFNGAPLEMPRWSPDGQHIAFVAWPGGRATIDVLNIADQRVRAVVSDEAPLALPSWSHDGRSLYFGSARGGRWQLWSAPVDGGGAPAPITRAGGYAGLESPDGRWLYVSRVDASGLWRRPVAGGPLELIIQAVAAGDRNWNVTATGVLYETARPDGAADVWQWTSGVAPARIARLTDQASPGLSLSPDGRTLLYSRATTYDCNILGVQER